MIQTLPENDASNFLETCLNRLYIFDKNGILMYINDLIEMFEDSMLAVNDNKEQFVKIIDELGKKLIAIKDPEDPAFILAAKEDNRRGDSEAGKVWSELEDLKHEWDKMMDITWNADIIPDLDEDEAKKIDEKWAELGKAHADLLQRKDSLPQADVDRLYSLRDKLRQDSATMGIIADNIFQNVKRYYELLRYVNGFLLALFDMKAGVLQLDIQDHYFNPKRGPKGGLYFYSNKEKNNKHFYRYQLPALQTYLYQNKKRRPGMYWILSEIFKKSGISELRCAESHNLGEAIQDRLDEGLYAMVDDAGLYYRPIEEIFYIQSDLYTFITTTMHIALLKRNRFKADLQNQ